MLRAVCLATVTLLSIAVPAAADPQLADDITVCRDRQADLKTRLGSCERLLAGGTLTGKDLAIALNIRGMACMARNDIDKAIAAYNSAADADHDNASTLVLRGWAYQHRGEEDQAMAD
jgi:tetratricopeptide (TPR) repeat protein